MLCVFRVILETMDSNSIFYNFKNLFLLGPNFFSSIFLSKWGGQAQNLVSQSGLTLFVLGNYLFSDRLILRLLSSLGNTMSSFNFKCLFHCTVFLRSTCCLQLVQTVNLSLFAM